MKKFDFASRSEKNGQKEKHIFSVLLCWLLVAGLLLLSGRPGIDKMPKSETFLAKEGTWERTASGEAVLCYSSLGLSKEELPCLAPKDGQKLAKGERMFRYYDTSLTSLLEELAFWEKELARLSLREGLDRNLLGMAIADYVEKRDGAKEEELLYLLSAYQGKAGYKKAEIEEKIETLEAQLALPKKEAFAPSDGYFYAETDGYEEIWDNLPASFSGDAVLSRLALSPKQKGEAKLLLDYTVTVLLFLPPETAGELTPKKVYPLTLADGTLLSAKLEKIHTVDEGTGCLAVFSAPLPLLSALPQRMQTATLLTKSETLLRVPRTAVLGQGEEAYVLVNYGGRVLARAVKIKRETEVYAYLTPATGKAERLGEACLFLKRNEAVLLKTDIYTHRDIFE